MITAICLNPAIDRTVQIPGFTAGQTNRIVEARLDPGGKGINVARVARGFGVETQVLGFLGEANGAFIARDLVRRQIRTEFVPVPGETRVNLKVIDPETGGLTEINDVGFRVEPQHVARLIDLVRRHLPKTKVLVLSGSLPARAPKDIYQVLAALAAKEGVPTIVDADGEPLVEALYGRPTAVKPNRAELERLLGRFAATPADLLDLASTLLDRGPSMVVVSDGAAGAGLVMKEVRLWATPPPIEPLSTVGAGDSMVAALAVAMARNLPPEEALRLAVAAGTATAKLEGTQTCSAGEAYALAPEVTISSPK